MLRTDYYLTHGLAVIHKKPTPVQIVRVDLILNVVELKLLKLILDRPRPLTTQVFMKGFYIDFEAKGKPGKTAIPMKNFHSHQIQHMEQVLEQKGYFALSLFIFFLSRNLFITGD